MTTKLLLLLIFYLLLKGIQNHFQLNARMRCLRFCKTYVCPLIIFLLLTAQVRAAHQSECHCLA